MNKQLINLTLSVVIEEIEHILATYPTYPYQQAFSVAGLRQDLVAYVLSRVPNQYAVVEETQYSSTPALLPRYSTQRLLDIEHWIHLGIRDVLHVYNRTNYSMPQTASSTPTASSLVSSGLN
ncbi:MAG TPA: late competence development ComFB family protein [Coleofasciculaceae cyanobacterium]